MQSDIKDIILAVGCLLALILGLVSGVWACIDEDINVRKGIIYRAKCSKCGTLIRHDKRKEKE